MSKHALLVIDDSTPSPLPLDPFDRMITLNARDGKRLAQAQTDKALVAQWDALDRIGVRVKAEAEAAEVQNAAKRVRVSEVAAFSDMCRRYLQGEVFVDDRLMVIQGDQTLAQGRSGVIRAIRVGSVMSPYVAKIVPAVGVAQDVSFRMGADVSRLAGLIDVGPLISTDFMCDGQGVLVMDRLDMTLAAYIIRNYEAEKSGADPVRRAHVDATMKRVFDVVTRMHDGGIFHQDLHAGNVMLRAVGFEVSDVRVIDFGRAIPCMRPVPSFLRACDWVTLFYGFVGDDGLWRSAALCTVRPPLQLSSVISNQDSIQAIQAVLGDRAIINGGSLVNPPFPPGVPNRANHAMVYKCVRDEHVRSRLVSDRVLAMWRRVGLAGLADLSCVVLNYAGNESMVSSLRYIGEMMMARPSAAASASSASSVAASSGAARTAASSGAVPRIDMHAVQQIAFVPVTSEKKFRGSFKASIGFVLDLNTVVAALQGSTFSARYNPKRSTRVFVASRVVANSGDRRRRAHLHIFRNGTMHMLTSSFTEKQFTLFCNSVRKLIVDYMNKDDPIARDALGAVRVVSREGRMRIGSGVDGKTKVQVRLQLLENGLNERDDVSYAFYEPELNTASLYYVIDGARVEVSLYGSVAVYQLTSQKVIPEDRISDMLDNEFKFLKPFCMPAPPPPSPTTTRKKKHVREPRERGASVSEVFRDRAAENERVEETLYLHEHGVHMMHRGVEMLKFDAGEAVEMKFHDPPKTLYEYVYNLVHCPESSAKKVSKESKDIVTRVRVKETILIELIRPLLEEFYTKYPHPYAPEDILVFEHHVNGSGSFNTGKYGDRIKEPCHVFNLTLSNSRGATKFVRPREVENDKWIEGRAKATLRDIAVFGGDSAYGARFARLLRSGGLNPDLILPNEWNADESEPSNIEELFANADDVLDDMDRDLFAEMDAEMDDEMDG
jgi:hypothetical protein